MDDIAPVSYAQIMSARDGRLILVDDDVQGVARDLHAIDPSLRLRFNDKGEYWVVYQVVTHEDGHESEQLVTTAHELDQRLVLRIRKVCHPDYDLAAELDRLDEEEKKRRDWEFREFMGDQAERLGHAMRKDLGHTGNRAYVPRSLQAA